MKILLLQARDADDPILKHELDCFAARCELEHDRFRALNLATATIEDNVLADVDAVMVGGSGDYSLAKGGFDWHTAYLDLVREIVTRRIPTFASCFGFQAIVQALGGTISKEPDAAEVGTFQITLTDAGTEDPLFREFDREFDAQLGHNDSVEGALPDSLVQLAYSERCQVQAVRVRGTPVVATQFHPELTMDDNIVRYTRYLHAYNPALDEVSATLEASRIHRPSPVANQLLQRFLSSL